jgi:hypothetical protein
VKPNAAQTHLIAEVGYGGKAMTNQDQKSSDYTSSCSDEMEQFCPREEEERGPQENGCALPCDYLTAGLGPDREPVEGGTPESITLARLELTNGNYFEIVGVRNEHEGNEVGIRELGGGPRESAPTFYPNSLSILEMYMKLAPKDSPIPKMLAESDKKVDKTLFAKRKLVDYIEELILVDLDEQGITPVVTDSQYCAGGFNSFQNDMCVTASYPSNTWWWCDAAANYYWRDRWTTNHKRRNSLGITAACNGPASTAHYYKNIWGNWKHNKTWHLPSGYWHWTKWEGGSNRDRWVRHRSILQGGSSYIRCVSFFWK